jgi:hypothetical protein
MYHAMRWSVMAAIVCLMGTTAAQAQGLPGVATGTVINEVMMDAQGSEALLYGASLGLNPMSPQTLSGTTSMDPTTGSFSFSLNPGSMYLDQSISDRVQGQFNSATGAYDWTAAGVWGGFKWGVNGNIVPIEVDLDGPKWQLRSYEAVYALLSYPPKYIYQNTDLVTIYGPNATTPSLSIKTSTTADPFGAGLGSSIGTDTYDPKTGTFQYNDLFKGARGSPFQRTLFSESTTGSSPVTGGAGTYTTSIASVPEPSSWVMGLLGAAVTAGYIFWRRRSAGARVPAVAST